MLLPSIVLAFIVIGIGILIWKEPKIRTGGGGMRFVKWTTRCTRCDRALKTGERCWHNV